MSNTSNSEPACAAAAHPRLRAGWDRGSARLPVQDRRAVHRPRARSESRARRAEPAGGAARRAGSASRRGPDGRPSAPARAPRRLQLPCSARASRSRLPLRLSTSRCAWNPIPIGRRGRIPAPDQQETAAEANLLRHTRDAGSSRSSPPASAANLVGNPASSAPRARGVAAPSRLVGRGDEHSARASALAYGLDGHPGMASIRSARTARPSAGFARSR